MNAFEYTNGEPAAVTVAVWEALPVAVEPLYTLTVTAGSAPAVVAAAPVTVTLPVIGTELVGSGAVTVGFGRTLERTVVYVVADAWRPVAGARATLKLKTPLVHTPVVVDFVYATDVFEVTVNFAEPSA